MNNTTGEPFEGVAREMDEVSSYVVITRNGVFQKNADEKEEKFIPLEEWESKDAERKGSKKLAPVVV